MTQRTKLQLAHPATMPDGSTVMVRAPTPDDAHEMRFNCYAIFTGLPRAVIDEFDAADIARLDELLDAISLCRPRRSKP